MILSFSWSDEFVNDVGFINYFEGQSNYLQMINDAFLFLCFF